MPDYVSEADLIDLGIDLSHIQSHCPHATEYRGHDGVTCWDIADLEPLFSAEGGEQ